ncbi:MAG: hypothetical protein COA68_09575 [Oceanobacter sp.]|jgi:hypothetical protein|nr:MAG: hypothetical protein COA68_09575 [Oceanobacter sp.]
MPKPRKELISLAATSYYRYASRFVNKAFLCGTDSSGRRFEHRRGCVDISAYAVISNHFHIVLHVNQPEARNLTDLEVVQRWYQLYKGSLITQKYERGDELLEVQLAIFEDMIKLWRDRLMIISWYMSILFSSNSTLFV